MKADLSQNINRGFFKKPDFDSKNRFVILYFVFLLLYKLEGCLRPEPGSYNSVGVGHGYRHFEYLNFSPFLDRSLSFDDYYYILNKFASHKRVEFCEHFQDFLPDGILSKTADTLKTHMSVEV